MEKLLLDLMRGIGGTRRNRNSCPVPHPFRFFPRKGWETTNLISSPACAIITSGRTAFFLVTPASNMPLFAQL